LTQQRLKLNFLYQQRQQITIATVTLK